MIFKNNVAKWLLVLSLLLSSSPLFAQVASGRFNDLIIRQVKQMPQGGRYSASRAATIQLQSVVYFEPGKLSFLPRAPAPSYCSGATYLIFLRTISALQTGGKLHLDDATRKSLLIRNQRDGEGVWGRWNANGPGTGRLFHELELGQNFDNFAQAQAGDFLKIFWSPEVGRAEHGHSVIYLGMENKAGLDYVRFWSSNIPAGYGQKSVLRAKIVHAIFSRLDAPGNLTRAVNAPAVDKYLASLLTTHSSYQEAKVQCGM